MDELNISDKIELYKFLIANGFESIDEDLLNQSALANHGKEKIERILNNYRKSTDTAGCLGDLISNLLNMKQHYKCEFFNTAFADIMMIKAESFHNSDNEYCQVYKFIAQLLQGQLSDLSGLNEKSMNIMLTLISDMHSLINSIKSEELLESGSESEEKHENEKQTLETLRSMFKFQRISEFMNPLNISTEMNDQLLRLLLDVETKRIEKPS